MKNNNHVSKVMVFLALGAFGLVGCSAKVSTSNPGSGDVPQLPGFGPGTGTTAQPIQPGEAAATPAKLTEFAFGLRGSQCEIGDVGIELCLTGQHNFSGRFDL